MSRVRYLFFLLFFFTLGIKYSKLLRDPAIAPQQLFLNELFGLHRKKSYVNHSDLLEQVFTLIFLLTFSFLDCLVDGVFAEILYMLIVHFLQVFYLLVNLFGKFFFVCF